MGRLFLDPLGIGVISLWGIDKVEPKDEFLALVLGMKTVPIVEFVGHESAIVEPRPFTREGLGGDGQKKEKGNEARFHEPLRP